MRRIRPYLLLFAGLFIIYNSNLRPIASGDSLPASLIPYSLLLDHSLALDRFGPWMKEHLWYDPSIMEESQGHWYSAYPVAGPVLVTPLYLPVLAFPSLARQSPETLIVVGRITEKLAAALLAALGSVWMLLLLERLGSRGWAWSLTLLFALGTTTWSASSQALWQHTFAQVAIIATLYGLARWEESAQTSWLWLCGASAGLGVAFRPTNVWLLPAVAAALLVRRADWTDYARFVVPVLLAMAPLELYNWLAFGRITGGYAWRFDGLFGEGIAGLLISPARGLLIYTPAALFAAAAWLPAARSNRAKHCSLVTACAVFSILHFGTIAKWHAWWGGFSWGPRLLTEMVVCLVVLMAVGSSALRTSRLRIGFAIVAAYCVAIQAIGAYCYPNGRWDQEPANVDHAMERLWNWRDNPIVRTARAGLVWQPYAIVGTAATQGLPAAAQEMRVYGIKPY